MNKLNKRIEVITDVLTVKITDADEEGMVDVLFNQGYLVPFKFDGEKFYVQTVEKEALKKFNDEKANEEKKLNRKKTQEEQMQDVKEMHDLPKVIEEITVLYRKDPTSPIIDLSLYVNELLECNK